MARVKAHTVAVLIALTTLTGCGITVKSHTTMTCYSNASSMQTKTSYATVSRDGSGTLACP